jgi:hypothetical protein
LNALDTLPREKAVDTLMNLALERGGHDNTTIIILEMPASGAATGERNGPASPKVPKARTLLSCLIIGSMVVLAGAVVGLLIWYLRLPPPSTPTTTPTLLPLIMPSNTPLPSAVPPAGTPSATPTAVASPLVAPVDKPTLTPTGPTPTPWPTHTLPPPGQASPPAVLTVPAGAP